MPNDEQFSSQKYQCLVDAVAGSGIKLLPIKPGTEVSESLAHFPSTPGTDEDNTDRAIFEYETPNGRMAYVGAAEGLDAQDRKTKTFSGGGRGLGGIWGAQLNGQTGKEHHFVFDGSLDHSGMVGDPGVPPSPVKQGTVSDTVDRVFKCLTPLTS
jgi:hypothetical protein